VLLYASLAKILQQSATVNNERCLPHQLPVTKFYCEARKPATKCFKITLVARNRV